MARSASCFTTGIAYEDDTPRWLPDGKHLLFMRSDGENRRSLWMIGTDGKDARQLMQMDDKSEDQPEDDFAFLLYRSKPI